MKEPAKLYMIIPCYNEEEVLPMTAKVLRGKYGSMIESGLISPEIYGFRSILRRVRRRYPYSCSLRIYDNKSEVSWLNKKLKRTALSAVLSVYQKM